MEQKVHDVEVFSDASSTGYGGTKCRDIRDKVQRFILFLGDTLQHGIFATRGCNAAQPTPHIGYCIIVHTISAS